MKPSAKHKGFSQLDLLLILAALAGIALIILPGLARSRTRSSKIGCTNNLKQVGLAFRIWAGDNSDKYPAQLSITNGGAMEWAEAGSAYSVFLVMSNELSTPKVLFCPEENNRSRIAANTFGFTSAPGNPASPQIPFTATNNLSYFAGLDGNQTQPTAIITGDDHLQVGKTRPRPGLLLLATNTPVAWAKGRHNSGGNLGLADGSVQQVLSTGLQRIFDASGFATNRLAMP
jgi:prepilin-type processing-associated H-X9-DG protein